MGNKDLRARINHLSLDGTSRRIHLLPGLNAIGGPIASGKTTLLRLARGLFGASLSNLPPEVRSTVTGVSGELALAEDTFTVFRPLASTPSARVDIASPRFNARLPFAQPEGSTEQTYLRWLLERLGLPRLEVPSAPTRPESEPTPVSINDYMLYCSVDQEELGFSVFGHRHAFKNIKRKYAFEIVYGLYGIEIAQAQEQLRDVLSRLRELRSEHQFAERFFQETPLENRAAIESELLEINRDLSRTSDDSVALSTSADGDIGAARLRILIRETEDRLAKYRREIDDESLSVDRLDSLASQLESQVGRLARSIAARKHLVDIDFVVCPRCGTSVDSHRADDGSCYLCLQTPTLDSGSRQALIDEQGRIEAELAEARELATKRRERIGILKKETQRADQSLTERQGELDFLTRTFVSEHASRISGLAARRADLQSRKRQLSDYLNLLNRADSLRQLEGRLEERKSELEAVLETESGRRSDAFARINTLETHFNAILNSLHAPQFGEEDVSTIDRRTYLPIFHGRRFDDLSSPGLGTLVTFAYMMAHQKTAIELGLSLPGILFIDGLSEHLGDRDLDQTRFEAMYRCLIEFSETYADQLQIIVADNTLPETVRPFVRLMMSDNERLVPEEDLRRDG